MERQPLSFFLKGVAGLAVLFVVTLFMQASPEVDALRASILFGFGLIVLKVGLHQFNIDFPPRRHKRFDPPRRSE